VFVVLPLLVQMRNAYLLVYEKVLGAAAPIPDAAVMSPILEEVERDNLQFIFDQQVFSPSFVRFVEDTLWNVVLSDGSDGDSSAMLGAGVVEWATRFTLEVLAHAADTTLLGSFVDALVLLYRRCPAACKWFVTEAAVSTPLVCAPLLSASDKLVRVHVARLVSEVLQLQLAAEVSYIDEVEMVGAGTDTRPRSRVIRFVRVLLSMIPGTYLLALTFAFCAPDHPSAVCRVVGGLCDAEALLSWPKFQQFWWVFEQLATRSHTGRYVLWREQAVSRLLHAFLGTK
jgi:hypothetical protein